MRVVNTDKKLTDKWRPLLSLWAREAGVTDTQFKIKILTSVDDGYGTRGCLMMPDNLIKLHIGSKNKDEVKFCFLHELAHYTQFKTHKLTMSIGNVRDAWDYNLASIEKDANRFALKHGGRAETGFLKGVLSEWGC